MKLGWAFGRVQEQKWFLRHQWCVALHVPRLPHAGSALATVVLWRRLELLVLIEGCCSGFWQVELILDTQEVLAFISPKGRVFKWLVMPFGVSNAPAVF